jgi:hypothetical protein
MDDTRRRLQVLQQANPSIRVSTAPKQTAQSLLQPAGEKINFNEPAKQALSVKPIPAQNLRVGNTIVKPSETANNAPARFVPQKSLLETFSEPYGASIRALSGENVREQERLGERIANDTKAYNAYTKQFRDGKITPERYGALVHNLNVSSEGAVAEAEAINTQDSFKNTMLSNVQLGLDLGTLGIGGKVATGARKLLPSIIEGGVISGLSGAAEAGTMDGASGIDRALTVLTNTLAGAGIPVVGKGIGKVVSKVKNLIGPKAVAEPFDRVVEESLEAIGVKAPMDDFDAVAEQSLQEIGVKTSKEAPGNFDEAVADAQKVIDEPTKPFNPLDETTTRKMDELMAASDATPVPEGHTRLYQTNDNNTDLSDQYFKDTSTLANYINNRSDSSNLRFRDVPNEKVLDTPGKPKVFKVDEQPEVPAEQIQSGMTPQTIDGSVAPSAENLGETVAENADKSAEKGIKFRDPETKKQIIRSYEDVSTELEALEAIPKDELTPKQRARIINLRNKTQRFRSENAKYAMPDADEETQKAVQAVMDQLSPAERQYNKVAKTRSQDKAARIAKGNAAFESAGGGEAGVRAKLGSLKGKYSESGFNPIEADEAVQKTLLDDIQNSDLRDFEKLNTQNAMRKIWGATEGKPTPSDINYIRKYFGEDMADTVAAAVEEGGETGWRNMLTQLAGTPRALMATGDLSFGFRQGAPMGTRMPKEWARANKESVKYAGSQAYFDKEMKKIVNSDYYEVINDKMKVALTAADKSMEEAFAAADLAEKIPGAGIVVKASDRAYSGGLTKLRFDAAKKVVDSYGGVDEFLKFFGKDDKALKDLGEVINTFTGRGGKSGGLVERHMKTLSTTLFAPRLWAAKLNSINPQFYARLSPEARRLALETQGAFLTTAGTVLGLASAAGATVVWDPRSADFAKIKVGNTRYDILGGLQQNIRAAAQLVTGEKINSVTGEMDTLGDGFTSKSRKDILYDMFENKENPLLSLATTLLEGKDINGDPIDLTNANPFDNEVTKRLIPLGIQGVADTTKDTGDFVKSTAMNLPSFVGIGVQTYGKTATKDQGKEPVTNEEKIAKIKADKEAATKAVKDAFPQYKEYWDMSEKDQKSLGLDQKTMDNIKAAKKQMENNKGVETPESVKSDLGKKFYERYNRLTEKGREKFLAKTGKEAEEITTILNKERAEGLSEYKPSNKLLKAYAEYEKDIADHPEYTATDKLNKAKAFQTHSYRLNYSTDQNDIYTEGPSKDLKYLLEQGTVGKADLDEAIKMDNELYGSGLTASLKFSKKFRNEYGYSVPADKGDGSGSTMAKRRAGLSALVPSTKMGGSTLPKTNARARNISFKAPATPKPSKSGKKVNIKL